MRLLGITIVAATLLAGSAAGVAGQDGENASHALVTGTLGELTATVHDTPHWTEWTAEIVSDDPRLEGTFSYSGDELRFKRPSIGVEARVWEVTGPAGGWHGTSTYLGTIGGPFYLAEETVLLIGQGPLEGLSAYLIIDWTQDPKTFQGAVFTGQMPEYPSAVGGLKRTAFTTSRGTTAGPHASDLPQL